MGNTSTKESRPGHDSARHSRLSAISPASYEHYTSADISVPGSSRTLRSNRPDLSLLGFTQDREPPVEHRRETRQEREARKREKENAARLKERERSMKEEHVDGGYLVTQGVYVGPEDYSKVVVRQLMLERRLAPFWRGLNDFSDSWAEHQLMAAARGMPIPAPDDVPPELEYKIPSKPSSQNDTPDNALSSLMVPIASRSQSFTSDTSSINHSLSPTRSPGTLSPTSSFFRGRAKTMASLTSTCKPSGADLSSREIHLPKDPFVNGQPIEAYLYKDASECPICFLYYPPYLNKTRCCDQPICSECFVQIKRPDPHPPEHNDSNSPEGNRPSEPDGQLVTEPAACPFCVQPEFGVTYSPPPFRRGLAYTPTSTAPAIANSSAASSASSLLPPGPNATRRRGVSISADSPLVITTDKVRPDWATKLAAARAQAARRAAAATALHTAAYLMNSQGESRTSRFMRRAVAQENPNNRPGSQHINNFGYIAERRVPLERENDSPSDSSPSLAPARASSRRSRIEELEDMMMMEAIRLSLAAEEERRKKEEKDAKKEAKRRGKEAKKAEKQARKSGLYSNNASSVALNGAPGPSALLTARSNTEPDTTSKKGKDVDRSELGEAGFIAGISRPQAAANEPLNSTVEDYSKKAHLRHVSSASSSNSSLVESAFCESINSGTPHNGSTLNLAPHGFRSLAAMIDETASGEFGETSSCCGSTREQITMSVPTDAQQENHSNAPQAKPSAPPLERKDTLGKEAHMSSTEILPQSNFGSAS